jgi:hypothetical protein
MDMDLTMRIRDMLRANEDESERLERVALAYLLDSANARLRDLEERVRRLERPECGTATI